MSQGVYLTKSAYKLLAEKAATLKLGNSNPAAHSNFERKIWSLNILSKVKHFIWRTCNESLPTKLNLFKRKVTNNAICEVCEAEMEDTVHAIRGCQRVKEIW